MYISEYIVKDGDKMSDEKTQLIITEKDWLLVGECNYNGCEYQQKGDEFLSDRCYDGCIFDSDVVGANVILPECASGKYFLCKYVVPKINVKRGHLERISRKPNHGLKKESSYIFEEDERSKEIIEC